MIRYIILFVALTMLAGCLPAPSDTKPKQPFFQSKLEEDNYYHSLPEGAVITARSKNWVTFEWTTNGRKRTFLYNYYTGSISELLDDQRQ